MTRSEKDDFQPRFASSPCSMHEADPAYTGLPSATEPRDPAEVYAWRKAERRRLLAERLTLEGPQRRSHSGRIAAGLDEIIGDPAGLTISVYWPIRAEPDLRHWMESVTARGAQCALPVVIERGRPLVFRAWAPGDPLESGVWDIPVPAAGAAVAPEIVIAPVVGFDRACYRLGYGGGFYDRTLAAMAGRPRVLGVGYSHAALRTIYPQNHDVRMDVIVTEAGIVGPERPANEEAS